MTQNFTLNDLIRLVYKETSAEEEFSVREEISSDWEIREVHEELEYAKNQLPKATFAPSEKSIKNILHYSKLTALQVEF